MSDETVAGSNGSIPTKEKIEMYSDWAEVEALRIEQRNMVRNWFSHEKEFNKKYARAKKLAALKYDRKIEELRQRAGSLIDIDEGYKRAEEFIEKNNQWSDEDKDKRMTIFEGDRQKYKQQLDEAESSNSDEYEAFKEYNDLVARKKAELEDMKSKHSEMYEEATGYSKFAKIDSIFDRLDEADRRLNENPDDAYAQLESIICRNGASGMSSFLTERYQYSSDYNYFVYRNSIKRQEDELKEKGYDVDEINRLRDEIDVTIENVARNVEQGNLPIGILQRGRQSMIQQYETSNGEKVFAIPVEGDYEVKTAWGDTYNSNGDGGVIVSSSPDFTDAILETKRQFESGKYTEITDSDSFDSALSKAAGTSVPAPVEKDSSFVNKILDSLINISNSGASDMDGRSERDRKSDDNKYETFKDKDGNQCRRDRTTGETTVWVEGYDRMRNGKSEHVNSYWKVVRPRG